MFSFLEMSYALIAGNDQDDPKSSQKTEVMYVNGTTRICHSSFNYPENVQWISGGSFIKNNLIYVCGGLPYTSACYSLSNDFKWTNFANLTRPVFQTASVIAKNGLWVTGKGVKFFLQLGIPVWPHLFFCNPLRLIAKPMDYENSHKTFLALEVVLELKVENWA